MEVGTPRPAPFRKLTVSATGWRWGPNAACARLASFVEGDGAGLAGRLGDPLGQPGAGRQVRPGVDGGPDDDGAEWRHAAEHVVEPAVGDRCDPLALVGDLHQPGPQGGGGHGLDDLGRSPVRSGAEVAFEVLTGGGLAVVVATADLVDQQLDRPLVGNQFWPGRGDREEPDAGIAQGGGEQGQVVGAGHFERGPGVDPGSEGGQVGVDAGESLPNRSLDGFEERPGGRVVGGALEDQPSIAEVGPEPLDELGLEAPLTRSLLGDQLAGGLRGRRRRVSLNHGAAAKDLSQRRPGVVARPEPPDDAIRRRALTSRRHEFGGVVGATQGGQIDDDVAIGGVLAVDDQADLEEPALSDGETNAQLLLDDPPSLTHLVARPEVELAFLVPLLLLGGLELVALAGLP